MESLKEMQKVKYYGICLDEQTNDRLSKIGEENGLSRSAAIRMVVAQWNRENYEQKPQQQ